MNGLVLLCQHEVSILDQWYLGAQLSLVVLETTAPCFVLGILNY